jgi:lysophospholipase L1-like esterase
MIKIYIRSLATFCILALLLNGASYAQSSMAGEHWVGTFAASQQIPEPQNILPADAQRDITIRQIFHVSIGGAVLRVHLSNAFGKEPLHFTSVHIALPVAADSSAIDSQSDKALSFSGSSAVIVPAGADYISDPIQYPIASLSNLAITVHLDALPDGQTGHPGSRATSYYTYGDQVTSANLKDAKPIDHWYQISGMDVLSPANGASVVAFGDSITDGHAATINGNDRWTDVFSQRLQQSPGTKNIGILNQGIGGNHLLIDGLGPNALARFDRDVLAQAGVHWVILLEGVNDLGGLTRNGEVSAAEHDALVQRILAAYQQMIVRAHTAGIRVIGATITPYTGSDYYHPGPASETDRETINQWIRTPGRFDDIVDFDKAIRDPSHPDRMLPAYDSGDQLHPSPAGYHAMGNAVPLSLFTR